MKIINYDIEKYKFKEIVKNILGVENLEDIHTLQQYNILKREQDQSTVWHKKYYDNFNEFNVVYMDFIKNYIKDKIFNDQEIVYQKIPTFRVHLVNNLGVGEFHKDKTYNHSVSEINFWLPFTDAYGNNTIWCESEEDKKDFHPVRVNYGECLIFDGANLMHGNKINDSDITRISVDFRIVSKNLFIPSNKGAINTKIKFDIGGYFNTI